MFYPPHPYPHLPLSPLRRSSAMGGEWYTLSSRGRCCCRRGGEGGHAIARVFCLALPQGKQQKQRRLVAGMKVRLRSVGLGLGLILLTSLPPQPLQGWFGKCVSSVVSQVFRCVTRHLKHLQDGGRSSDIAICQLGRQTWGRQRRWDKGWLCWIYTLNRVLNGT